MDKILRIDMGAEGGPKITEEAPGVYEGFGGRGLTSTIIAKEVPPLCHALGAENKVVIAPGLLSGSAATTAADSPSAARAPSRAPSRSRTPGASRPR